MHVFRLVTEIIKKRIHVTMEHVNFKVYWYWGDQAEELKTEAKPRGEVISIKKQSLSFMVEGATLETVDPIPYDVVNDLNS